MILELYPPPTNQRQLVTESPNDAVIESTIRDQPCVTLTRVSK
jgi:hypothetical protein